MNVPFLSHRVKKSSALKNASGDPCALFHSSCFGVQERILWTAPLRMRFQKLCLCNSDWVRVCLVRLLSSFYLLKYLWQGTSIGNRHFGVTHIRLNERVCVCVLPTVISLPLTWCLHSSVSKRQLSVTDLCTHLFFLIFCSEAHFVLVDRSW